MRLSHSPRHSASYLLKAKKRAKFPIRLEVTLGLDNPISRLTTNELRRTADPKSFSTSGDHA
jgi:hypothetical protein